MPAGEGTQVLQHALQIVADWMEPAYGFHSLFNFKRKFQPTEAPVYVCYPDPAALPQIGLAVVRAYVPSVTPPEVARHAQHAAVVKVCTRVRRLADSSLRRGICFQRGTFGLLRTTNCLQRGT